jgi:hypothetical protein
LFRSRWTTLDHEISSLKIRVSALCDDRFNAARAAVAMIVAIRANN